MMVLWVASTAARTIALVKRRQGAWPNLVVVNVLQSTQADACSSLCCAVYSMELLSYERFPSYPSLSRSSAPLPNKLLRRLCEHPTRWGIRVYLWIKLALEILLGAVLHVRQTRASSCWLTMPVTLLPVVQRHALESIRDIQTLVPSVFAVSVLAHLVVLLFTFCVLDE